MESYSLLKGKIYQHIIFIYMLTLGTKKCQSYRESWGQVYSLYCELRRETKLSEFLLRPAAEQSGLERMLGMGGEDRQATGGHSLRCLSGQSQPWESTKRADT